MKKISCITICKNNRSGLLATAESILHQTMPIYEMIIVDGDSEDGTKTELPILQEQFEKLGIIFHSVSETDGGIYDAMNKGIEIANGDWLIFMNSSDVFASPNVIEEVSKNKIEKDIELVYGDVIRNWPDGKKVYQKGRPLEEIKRGLPTSHQAMFFRSSTMKKRNYRLDCGMAGDHAWLMEFYFTNGKAQYIPIAICIYDKRGITSQSRYRSFCDSMNVRLEFGVGNSRFIILIKKIILLAWDFLEKHTRHIFIHWP